MQNIRVNCYCKSIHEIIFKSILESQSEIVKYKLSVSYSNTLITPSSPLILIMESDFKYEEIAEFIRVNLITNCLLIVENKKTAIEKFVDILGFFFISDLNELSRNLEIVNQLIEITIYKEYDTLHRIIPIISNSSDAIVIYDNFLEIKYVNKQFRDTFDFTISKGSTINNLLKTKDNRYKEIIQFIEDYEPGDEYILENKLYDINVKNQIVKYQIVFKDFSVNASAHRFMALIFKPIINLNSDNFLLLRKMEDLVFTQNAFSTLERQGITISGMFENLINSIPEFLGRTPGLFVEINYSGKKYSICDNDKMKVLQSFPIAIFGQNKGQMAIGITETEIEDNVLSLIEIHKETLERITAKLSKSIEIKLLQANLSRMLGFQKTMYEISSRLLNTNNPENEVDFFMSKILDLIGAKFVFILLFKENTELPMFIHYHGDEKFKEFSQKIKEAFSEFIWLKEQLLMNGFAKYSISDKNENYTQEFEFYKSFNLSLHAYLLESGTTILGCIFFAGLEQSPTWSNNYSTHLYLFANTFAGALERKRVNVKINEQYLFMKRLIDTIPIPLFYTDKKGNFIGANQLVYDYFKIDPEEFSHLSVEDLKNKYSFTYQGNSYSNDSGNIVESKEFNFIVKGATRNALLSESDYFDSNREIAGRLYTFLDITDLKKAQREISFAHIKNEKLLNAISSSLILVNEDMYVSYLNKIAIEFFRFVKPLDDSNHLFSVCDSFNNELIVANIISCLQTKEQKYIPSFKIQILSEVYFIDIIVSSYQDNPFEKKSVLLYINNITERVTLERKLLQSQKLESIGQLAAGIAHEINTPIQYITDNLNFLSESYINIQRIMQTYDELIKDGKTITQQDTQQLNNLIKEVDLDFLKEEVPLAIKQSMEGSKRISNIVLSMKDFSHPGIENISLVNINRAIESTITISRNEWKYHAELVTELDENIPQINCFVGEVNQVILNLIINATHAIIDANKKFGRDMGKIEIKTSLKDNEHILISISDNGLGIPDSIKERVFDPFFTTKEVGKGTGQGLSIAYSVIFEKHHGKLYFNSLIDNGTTFFIELPINP